MKKILHVAKYFYPFFGGIEQIAKECVCALKDQYEQKVLSFNDKETTNRDIVDGTEVFRCGSFVKISSQPLSFYYGKILRNIINSFQPDIVLFHYPNPFAASWVLKYLQSNPEIQFVVFWHSDIIRQKISRLFFRGQNRKILERASRVICTSPNYLDGSEWLRSVREKCVVVPNCINTERMKITDTVRNRALEIRKENEGKIICTAVGRHTKYKGFDYLIEASKLLDDSFRFFIVGSGDETEKLLKRAEGNKKITFTGSIEDEEMKAYILAANIFCFPSITKNEAFGLALAEAMYYEKPAVTFTIPGSGVNYVCLKGENGIEVENGNANAYAEALRTLAHDPSLREKYGQAGKKRVEENFLSEQFYEDIRNVLGSL